MIDINKPLVAIHNDNVSYDVNVAIEVGSNKVFASWDNGIWNCIFWKDNGESVLCDTNASYYKDIILKNKDEKPDWWRPAFDSGSPIEDIIENGGEGFEVIDDGEHLSIGLRDSRGYWYRCFVNRYQSKDKPVLMAGCRRWATFNEALDHYGEGYSSDGEVEEVETIIQTLRSLYKDYADLRDTFQEESRKEIDWSKPVEASFSDFSEYNTLEVLYVKSDGMCKPFGSGDYVFCVVDNKFGRGFPVYHNKDTGENFSLDIGERSFKSSGIKFRNKR